MEWLALVALLAVGYWFEDKLSDISDRVRNIEAMLEKQRAAQDHLDGDDADDWPTPQTGEPAGEGGRFLKPLGGPPPKS